MTKKIANEVMLNFIERFYLDERRLPKAKELNHRVVFFRRFGSIGKAVELLNLKVNFAPQTKKANGPRIKLMLPNINNIRFARFIGLVVADGSLRYDNYSKKYNIQIDFSMKERDLVEEFKNLCKEIFCKNPFEMIKEDKRINPISRWIRLVYNSRELFFFIKELITFEEGNKSHTVSLRSLHFSDEWLSSFLGGLLDGDGFVRYKNGKCVEFVTSSEALKNQISQILLKFGFTSRIYKCKSKRGYEWFAIFISGKSIMSFLSKNGSVKARNAIKG